MLGIVQNQLDYGEVCAHRVPKNPTDDDKVHVWDCMDLSCIHWTCYTNQREQFLSWNVVNYTKPETRKRMCDKETVISFQQGKWKHCHQETEKRYGDHNYVLVLYFLDHGDTLLIVIVVHLAYGGYFLQRASITLPQYCAFAWKCQVSHTQLDRCLWLYIWYVMDQSHSCTQGFISHWILKKASGWQVIAVDADVKWVTTCWL